MGRDPADGPRDRGADSGWDESHDAGRAEPPAWAVPGLTPSRGPVANAGARLVDDTVRLTEGFAQNSQGLPLGEQLLQARQLIDRLESVWLLAAADFESSGGLSDSGAASLGAWMRHHCRIAPTEASARSRVAHAVTSGELPATADALVEGKVTWRQAEVIQRSAQQVPADRKGEAEEAMIAAAETFDPSQLRRLGDRLLSCFDREVAEAAAVRRYERRGLTLAETIDGMYSVSGMLDPVTGSLVMTALNTAMSPPCSRDDGDGHSDDDPAGPGVPDLRSWSQRRADALADICSQWMESDNHATVGGVRPHLSVIVDLQTLQAGAGEAAEPGEIAWSGPVTPGESQMIGCDASIYRILMEGPSMVLDVGRATRTIPPALRRAVVARDRTCVAPGCHRPPEYCDVHHVTFWEHGGETSLENTVLACRRHHRMIHQMGWQVTIDRSGRRSLEPPR